MPDNLDVGGIRLVVENLGRVLADLIAYSNATRAAGDASSSAAKQITNLGVAWNESSKRFQLASKSVQTGKRDFVAAKDAIDVQLKAIIEAMKRTGREVAGIKWDIGAKKFIDAYTGAEIQNRLAQEKIRKSLRETADTEIATAKASAAAAKVVSQRAVSENVAISAHSKMVGQLRAEQAALERWRASQAQAAQAQQATTAATQASVGAFQRVGAAITQGVSSFQQWLGSSRSAQQATQQVGRSAQQTQTLISQLGVSFNQATNQWKTSSGQVVSAQQVLAASTAQVMSGLGKLGSTATTANAQVTAAATKLAQAQLKAQVAAQNANQALQAAATETTNVAAANQAAVTAVAQYQQALNNVTTAQTAFNKALQQAKPPNVFAQVTQLVSGIKQAFSTILGPLQSAISLLGKFVVVIGAAKIATFLFNGALKLIKGTFELLVSPITKAFHALQTLFKASTIIAFGVLIRDTIRGIIRDLKEMAASALEAVTSFQTLTLRLEIMEARMLRDIDATKTFSASVLEGTERAKGLVKWIKELSLTAPFDVSVIGNTLSLNLAMGFMETQAKDLTQAILGYTAAMGLGPEIMERITFNLGQMKAAGKVTATEMRDLARGAFFPLTRVLDIAAKKLGIASGSLIQFRKDAAEGKIDVNTFFESFIEMVRTDFPNAVEKFGQTLTGVRQRLINFFKTIIGLELLAPLGKAVATSMNGLLNVLLSPKVQQAANLYGKILLAGFESTAAVVRQQLIPALRELAKVLGIGIPSALEFGQSLANIAAGAAEGMRRLTSFIRGVTDFIQERFGAVQGRMFGFGQNIIMQLARGMIAGVAFVIKAIRVVVNAIANLLSPGSPPKALPDLPKWGMAAMTEYLKGFTLADFSILNELQDPIERVLKLLVETGEIAEKKFGKIFLKISEDIAKVLAGKISPEKLFGDIAKSTGPFAKALIELAKRQLKLGEATDKVREAEERLERARQREKDLRGKLNKQIFEYNQAVREGARQDVLKTRLKEINATAKQAAGATKQVSVEEKRLEIAQKQLEAWEEQVDLQRQLVDQLIKLTEAQIIKVDTEVDTGGLAGAIEDALSDVSLPPIDTTGLFDEEKIRTDLVRLMFNARRNARAFFDNLAKEFKPITEALFGEPLKIPGIEGRRVDRDKGLIVDFLDTLNKFSKWFDDNGPKITKVLDAIISSFDTLSVPLKAFKDAIAQTFGVDTGGLSWATIIVAGFLAAIGTIAAGIVGVVSGILAAIQFVAGAFSTAATLFNEGIILISTGVGVFAGIIKIFLAAGAIIVGVFGSILAFFAGFVAGIIKFAENLKNKLVGNSIIPEMMAAIYDSIVGTMLSIQELWESIWQAIVDFLTNSVVAPIQKFVDTTLTNLKNFIATTLTTTINTFRTSVLQPLSTFFSSTLPNAIDTFLKKAREIGQTISGEVTTLLNAFRTKVLAPLASGFDAVVSAIKRAVEWVQTLIDRIKKLPTKIVDRFIGDSPSPFEKGLTGAAKAMRKLASQALPQLTANLNALPVQRQSVSAMPVPMAAATSFSNIVSVNMGGVNIMNGMDEATFEAKVLYIVRKGIGM